MNRKKIIIVGVVIIVILAIIVLVVRGLGDSGTQISDPGDVSSNGGAPENTQDNFLTLESDQAVQSYWASPEALYFVNDAGELLKNGVPVNDQVLGTINRITPSTNGRFAVFEFYFGPESIFSIFDATSESWISLPDNTHAAAWHPSTPHELVYLIVGNDEHALYRLNLQENETTRLSDFILLDPVLSWVDADTIMISTRISSQIPMSVWRYSITQNTVEPVLEDSRDAFIQWFSDGGLKYFQASNRVSIVTPDGEESASLALPFLPHKCTLDNQAQTPTLYCSASRSPSGRTITIDDYFKNKNDAAESIYMIKPFDVFFRPGTEIILLDESAITQKIDAQNLRVQGDKLYFMNNFDGRLYSIRI